jgi:hypothetical protein
MLSRIQIAKVQTVHNSESRRIGGAGTELGWWESARQLREKTLVTAGIYRPRSFWLESRYRLFTYAVGLLGGGVLRQNFLFFS